MPGLEAVSLQRAHEEYLDLSGRTAFLTGASRGLGEAIASRLNQLGCNLIVPPRAELNLADLGSVSVYVEKHSQDPIDIIINDAGINLPGALENLSEDQIIETITVNLMAPLLLIRGLTSHMKEKEWGRIVNISSIWGVRGRENRTVYSTTKHGINGMTRALARELGPYDILVNSVCPGVFDTEMTRQNLYGKALQRFLADVPLGRLGEPEEVAEAVAWLVSPQNTFYTGQLYVLDGGYTA